MKDVYSKPETLIFEVIQQEHCNYTQKYRVRQGPGYIHNYYTVRLILHFFCFYLITVQRHNPSSTGDNIITKKRSEKKRLGKIKLIAHKAYVV